MPFSSIVDPGRSAVLSQVLDEVCASASIDTRSPEGEEAAELLLHLYACGYQTAEELKAMFEGKMEERNAANKI
jgi:hypothetical protein